MSEQPPSADRPSGPAGSGHPEIDELASYVAGDIDVAGLGALRAHLADCADCVGDVAALQSAAGALQQLAAPAMPADVAARLDRAIEGARSGASASSNVLPLQRKRSSAGWATGAAAAAVVALLGAVTVGALNGSRNNQKDAAPTAAKASRINTSGAVYATGTDYTPERLAGQVEALLTSGAARDFAAESGGLAPREAASVAGTSAAASAAAPAAAASESPAAAPAAPAPSTAAAAADSSGSASAQASAAPETTKLGAEPLAAPISPASDLSALRTDPARLARCVQQMTDGEATPIAYDFATYKGTPALAIILPGPSASERDVYLVPGTCGAGIDDSFLFFGRVRLG